MGGYKRKVPPNRHVVSKFSLLPKRNRQIGKGKKDKGVPSLPKMVALLNELRNDLNFELETQTEPRHATLFTLSIDINGQKYVRQGRNIHIARIKAAVELLRRFLQFMGVGNLMSIKPTTDMDFTSDDIDYSNGSNTCFDNNGLVKLCGESVQPDNSKDLFAVAQQKAANKRHVMLLYERCSDVNFSCKIIGFTPRFTDDQTPITIPQKHVDSVGLLVLQKFMDVMRGLNEYKRHNALAGIVMTENLNFNKAKVIAVATGTKCFNRKHRNVRGNVLNDSHAEIVSRRCLMKYLYAQLKLLCNQTAAHESIFNKNEENEQYPYKLKPSIQFHLYISSAPCGDARVFSPHDSKIDGIRIMRRTCGQLRVKIRPGESTISIKNSERVEMPDHTLQGQLLQSMSCSDKINRWNVIGIQGSLLASIIEPIYLHSIVLGSIFDVQHMYRAMYGRIEGSIRDLPQAFKLNKPHIALMTSAGERTNTGSPNFSINWTTGDNFVEVVNSSTGLTVNKKISRITKKVFFIKYNYLIKKLPGIQNRKILTNYRDTKKSVKDYQIAKEKLLVAFRRKGLGEWMEKPREQDEFSLTQHQREMTT